MTDAEKFLEQNTFRCENMRARIRKETCLQRQRMGDRFCDECSNENKVSKTEIIPPRLCSKCGKETGSPIKGFCKSCYNAINLKKQEGLRERISRKPKGGDVINITFKIEVKDADPVIDILKMIADKHT